jgi:hypothetical protein
MKKRVLTIAVCFLALIILASALSACNKFEWNYISGGDPTADVVSNGGYAVKQGNHVYFINGFSGTDSDNVFGSVFKQGIMRATLNADGTLVENSFELVVPKFIYSADASSGFAIFGEWIYYATINKDKDKSGKASTTNLDFMRTKIDGTVTQKIYTLAERNYPYLFTPTRILYYNANIIYAIDFTGMRGDKSTDKAGGVRTELVRGVTSYAWNYDASYSPSQGASFSDYVIYTSATTDESQAYRYANELNVIKTDGTGKKLLVNYETYSTDYQLKILKSVLEGDEYLTIYYSKTKLMGEETVDEGVFMNRISVSEMTFAVAGEKHLTLNAQTNIIPIDYETGALVVDSGDSFVYYLNGTAGTSDTYAQKVIGKSNVKVHFVEKVGGAWYVYYSDSSSATALYRINLIENQGTSQNEAAVLQKGKYKLDWTALDLIKSGDRLDFYFFNTDDYGYVHRVNIAAFDGSNPLVETELFGVMTEEDAAAKAETEKNK